MLLLWIGQSSSFRKRCIMKKTFLVTMLAVVAFATNVFATEAEAGVLGLKPSAGQAITQQSGSAGSSENREIQRDAYDTSRYAYPAEQLKAEGKNFNRYNWRLYLRFDTGELMLQDWVSNMNWETKEYANATFGKTDKFGKPTYAFDFREQYVTYYDKEAIVNGLRKAGSDNKILFCRKDATNPDIPVMMNMPVHIKPENCYPYGTRIALPGAMNHNSSGEPYAVYQERYWYNASNGQTTNETVDDYNAKYGHAIEPVKLYYPSDRALYVSGWCLDDVAKYMPIIDSVYLDENPENNSHYTYLLHYKLRSLPGMEKVI